MCTGEFRSTDRTDFTGLDEAAALTGLLSVTEDHVVADAGRAITVRVTTTAFPICSALDGSDSAWSKLSVSFDKERRRERSSYSQGQGRCGREH